LSPLVFDLLPNRSIDHLVSVNLLEYDDRLGMTLVEEAVRRIP
jgi:hypothetical protein